MAVRPSRGPDMDGRPHDSARPSHALTGAVALAVLVTRRNWARLLTWWAFVVFFLAYVIFYYRRTLDTQQLLDDYAVVAQSPGMKALTGLAANPATMGGAVWTKIWMTLVLGLACGMVFLVTHNSRVEEESGRSELVRARVVGIHASSVATWTVLALLCVLAGAGSAAVSIVAGLDPPGTGHSGSWLMGLSIAGVGAVGIGVSAVAGQIMETSRGANALASAIIGVFYVLRLVGDLSDGSLTWVSPIGWGEKASPYGANNWWPLSAQVGLALLLAACALVLEGRRDLGAGMLAQRAGSPAAPRRWSTPLGLALRTQRAALAGWAVTVLVTGVLFGSIVNSMQQMLSDLPADLAGRLGGGGSSALTALLARVTALVVLVFAMQSTLSLRGEESSGRLEVQLSHSPARTVWMTQRLAVPAVGSLVLLVAGGLALGATWAGVSGDSSHVLSVVGATVVYWPATLVMVALAALAFAVVPRGCVVLTWVLVASAWLVEMLATTTDVPQAVWDRLPYGATPQIPEHPMDWAPILILTVVAVALAVSAVTVFSRRDLRWE